MNTSESIEFLNNMKKGQFCTVYIPLINEETIPITVMYMGKDREGRYRFMDTGKFVLPQKLIEQKAIKVDKEYNENIAKKIYYKLKKLQQLRKQQER